MTPPRPAALRRVHRLAALLAIAIIAGFQLATIASEAFGDAAAVVQVKTGVVMALPVLIASLIAAVGTGRRLAGGWNGRIVAQKQTRMRIVAAIGVLVLAPAGIALMIMARAGAFGTAFIALQGLEIAAGLVNLALLALNARDGIALSKRLSSTRW